LILETGVGLAYGLAIYDQVGQIEILPDFPAASRAVVIVLDVGGVVLEVDQGEV
jgi:hypothetical protein